MSPHHLFSLVRLACVSVPSPVRRRGRVVCAVGYNDGWAYWSPVWWVPLGPLVLCRRSRRGWWRPFLSASRAVEWGLAV